MAKSLTRAAEIGDELVPVGGRRNRDNDATLQADEEAGLEALHMVGDALETAATEIIRAADSRAVHRNPKEFDQEMHQKTRVQRTT